MIITLYPCKMSTSGKDEITILQAVFNKYDKNKKGYLTIDEFTRLLKKIR